jgi:hypothetical protein
LNTTIRYGSGYNFQIPTWRIERNMAAHDVKWCRICKW